MYALKDYSGFINVSMTERRIDKATEETVTCYNTKEEAEAAAARYSQIVLGICEIVKL